jgi:DNA-binding Xre family transcriptional regulator
MTLSVQTLADEADISLYSLAVEAGLNQQTIYVLKRRNSMGTPDTLNALCRVLGPRLGIPSI